MFKAVSQVPRYRLAAREIAERIVQGQLRPNQKIPTERELVEMLGVSRPTLREAIIALEIAGFVESRFSSGTYVAQSPPLTNTLDEVSGPGPFELLEARMVVEGEVAAIAAGRITDETLARLDELTARMSREDSRDFWGRNADEEFHLTIAEAAGNLALRDVVEDFWRQRLRLPMWVHMHSRINVAGMKDQLVSEHRAIVDALGDRNPDAARAAMREHLTQFGQQLLNAWARLDPEERAADASLAKEWADRLTRRKQRRERLVDGVLE